MAIVECRSSQNGIASEWIEIDSITDDQVITVQQELSRFLGEEDSPSDAVALGFKFAVEMCPAANPSDLWHHVIYRYLMNLGWNDNRWKRVSGFALERVFVSLYNPRLERFHLRLRIVGGGEGTRMLENAGVALPSGKVDLFIEKKREQEWIIAGAMHVKSSIAERIQDDVPASTALMARGLLSVMLTMDAKSYPPPHGKCINYGELGGRAMDDRDKIRIKRNYIERDGQFDGLFSFNLRTPESPPATSSGKRIHTMGLCDPQPDRLVNFLREKCLGAETE